MQCALSEDVVCKQGSGIAIKWYLVRASRFAVLILQNSQLITVALETYRHFAGFYQV